jgi:hypothetical protein
MAFCSEWSRGTWIGVIVAVVLLLSISTQKNYEAFRYIVFNIPLLHMRKTVEDEQNPAETDKIQKERGPDGTSGFNMSNAEFKML